MRHGAGHIPTQSGFALPERAFGAGALDRGPGALGCLLDERDLAFVPLTWERRSGVVVATRGAGRQRAYSLEDIDRLRS